MLDAALFAARRVFPEPSPTVCVTFFSCAGTDMPGTADLQHTYEPALLYLEAQQELPPSSAAASSAGAAPLRYELVWVDNGGDAEEHEAFLRRGAQFERVVRRPTNVGLFRAANAAWFGTEGEGCRAPYVLSLEDDRVPRPGLHGPSVSQHLALAVALLSESRNLAGVRLKNEWSDAIVSSAFAQALTAERPDAGLLRESSRGLRYAWHCMELSSQLVWVSAQWRGHPACASLLLHSTRAPVPPTGLLLDGGGAVRPAQAALAGGHLHGGAAL